MASLEDIKMSRKIRVRVTIHSAKGGLKRVTMTVDEKLYKAIKTQPIKYQRERFKELYDEFEDEKLYRRETTSIDAMKEDDDITNIVLSDPSLTPREYVNQKEKEELLSKAKMTLTKPEQRVIKFIFDFGFSEAKTGRKMKISQEKVSQLKISALSKLNKELKGKIE